MKLRTALLAGMLALLAAILVGVVIAVSLVLEKAARRDLDQELAHNQRVLAAMLSDRAALLRAETRVVAEEPRLKAVVATEEISKETVTGVIFELRKAAGAELLVLTDPEGNAISAGSPAEKRVQESPLAKLALREGDATGLVRTDAALYQVHAHRLSFGVTIVGVLLVGQPVDDVLAETFVKQTGAALLVLADGAPVTGSTAGKAAVAAADGAAALRGLGSTGSGEVSVGGTRYLAVASPLASSGTLTATFIVLRSLDAALRPAHNLEAVLYGLLVVALALSWLLAARLASRLARPVDALVSFAGRIGHGDLAPTPSLQGPVEVRALGDAMNRMVVELSQLRADEVVRQRLAKELEIATRIQTALLPRDIHVPGLTVAASMVPADDVGGDYYDVLNVDGGCWIGIGDVSGHGLPAGLVMLMVQSVVAGLVAQAPDSTPSATLTALNGVVWSNIRERLAQDDHVTLSLMRYHARAGTLVFAGAHEDILVWRAATGEVEQIATPGTWIGGMRDIAPFTVDTTLALAKGDLVLLYTDGVTEAMDGMRQQFGPERLAATLRRTAKNGPLAARDAILAEVRAWGKTQRDDITVVALQYNGVEA